MNLVDRPEVAFMQGDDLIDNDDSDEDDVPLEVETKREVVPLIEEEAALPEIKVRA